MGRRTCGTWEAERAHQIKVDLAAEYGRGWQKLSVEQQQALYAERVLMLVLTQAQPQFEPAQAMARKVLAALNEAT